jgi:sigma-E factor negative regulatory protein RseC
LNQLNNTQETGVVCGIEGDTAVIELDSQQNCKSCGAQVICVPDSLGKRILKVSNNLSVKIGDHVKIIETSPFLLKLSFMQYGLPLLGFLLGIFLFSVLKIVITPIPQELIMFGGGIIGLLLSALLARHFIARIAERGGTLFVMSEIVL